MKFTRHYSLKSYIIILVRLFHSLSSLSLKLRQIHQEWFTALAPKPVAAIWTLHNKN